MPDKLSNDELKMYMNNIEKTLMEFKNDFKDFCDKVDKNYVHKETFEAYQKNNDEKVTGNAKNINKILWTTISTLLLALINLAFLIINKWL